MRPPAYFGSSRPLAQLRGMMAALSPSAAAGGTRIVEQRVRLLLELQAWDAIAFAATNSPSVLGDTKPTVTG